LRVTDRVALPVAAASSPLQRTDPTGPGETSRWFRENEASLEAADTAHDRGNEGQAAAILFHDTVDDGEPETTASADR